MSFQVDLIQSIEKLKYNKRNDLKGHQRQLNKTIH